MCNLGYIGFFCDIKIGFCFDLLFVYDDYNFILCLNNLCGKCCYISDLCVLNFCVNGNCLRKLDGYYCLCY